MDDEQTVHRTSEAWKLTRRAFLFACLAGCSQLGRRLPPEKPVEQTWALISDTHIGASRDLTVRDSCMAENLERVVADVLSAGPDHVLVNGDLALAKGEPADYATFRELISPLTGCGDTAAHHARQPRPPRPSSRGVRCIETRDRAGGRARSRQARLQPHHRRRSLAFPRFARTGERAVRAIGTAAAALAGR